MAAANLTLDQTRFRLTGSGLTPGSTAGALLTYTSYDGATKRSAQTNVVNGQIITGPDSAPNAVVDDDGTVHLAGSRNILVGGGGPGRIVASIATTAGDLVGANCEVS